jgi:hypothetical protein
MENWERDTYIFKGKIDSPTLIMGEANSSETKVPINQISWAYVTD